MLAHRVAGQAVDCIRQRAIEPAEVVDGTAIVYSDGNRLYVNRMASGAETVDSNGILPTDTLTSGLCSIDVLRLIAQASLFERGLVGLGKVVPYINPTGTDRRQRASMVKITCGVGPPVVTSGLSPQTYILSIMSLCI